jgi:dihydrofolate synthase/folylpolyglutamate synthase
MRERVRINGRPLGARPFAEGVARLTAAFGAGPESGFRTTFEHLTALAFMTFQEEAVDCAILEVGLGGRLDATNVIPPGPAILTPIGLDHRNILGRTLSAIAADKAHILKPGGEAFIMKQPAAVRRVLAERIRETGVTCRVTAEAVQVEGEPEGFRNRFRIRGRSDYGSVSTRLLGDHQTGNVGAAVAVAERLLPADGVGPAIRKGLEGAQVPGRLEVLERRGRVWILDGGHNPAAARAVRKALDAHAPEARITAVIGMASDKDHRGVLNALEPRVGQFLFTRADNPRAASPALLGARTERSWRGTDRLPEALDLAEQASGEVVLVVGSFLLVAEARALLGT